MSISEYPGLTVIEGEIMPSDLREQEMARILSDIAIANSQVDHDVHTGIPINSPNPKSISALVWDYARYYWEGLDEVSRRVLVTTDATEGLHFEALVEAFTEKAKLGIDSRTISEMIILQFKIERRRNAKFGEHLRKASND